MLHSGRFKDHVKSSHQAVTVTVTNTFYKRLYSKIHSYCLNSKQAYADIYKMVGVLYNLKNKISYMCKKYLLSAEMDRRAEQLHLFFKVSGSAELLYR